MDEEQANNVVKLRRKRGGYLTAIKQKAKDIDKYKNDSALDRSEIPGIVAYFKSTIKKIDEIGDLLSNLNLTDQEYGADMQSDCNAKILIERLIKDATQLQSRAPPSAIENDGRIQQKTATVKLPVLNLPTFDGNPLHFFSFWERFDVVNGDANIPAATKFTYLLAQLKGKPFELLMGFSADKASYELAVEMLKGKYGNKQKIIEAHFQALRDMTPPSARFESIQSFHSEMERLLRQLEAMKVTFVDEYFSQFVAQMLKEKLPKIVLVEMNRSKEGETWDLKTLRKELKREVELQEELQGKDQVRAPERISQNQTQPFARRQQQAAASLNVVTNEYNNRYQTCAFCDQNHLVYRCCKYSTVEERNNRVVELRLCYRCLRKGHQGKDCRNARECRDCKSIYHHGSLCTERGKFGSKGTQIVTQKSSLPAAKTSNANSTSWRAPTNQVTTTTAEAGLTGKSVALPTARLKVGAGREAATVRALFDLGSQRTFVTAEAARRIRLCKVRTATLSLDGFNCQGDRKTYDVVRLPVTTPEGVVCVEAMVVANLPSRLKITGLKELVNKWSAMGEIFADRFEGDEAIKIDVLIGGDYYYQFVPSPTLDGVPIIRSSLGIMVTGCVRDGIQESTAAVDVVTSLKVCANVSPKEIDFLWNLEQVGIDTKEAHPNDCMALQDFNESIRYQNGRYVARLPWKPDRPQLPSNYALARGRLEGNLKRLREKPERLEQYNAVIKEQLDNEFIEEVKDERVSGTIVHYLAHHAVEKNSSTTPIRIVFDCSAKLGQKSPSLNDCLYSGPNLVPEMTQILMRFRLNKFAVTADIRKAFLMIGLDERDRDATRFLWPENPSLPGSKLKIYRFRAVLFGATCSQFILNATIRHHLEQNGKQNENSTRKLARNLYVDNVFGTGCNENEITKFHAEAKASLQDAGLQLREWATNAIAPRGAMQVNDELDARSVVPVLGLEWQTSDDKLSFATRKVSNIHPTKRGVLSGLASQFDPLGAASPITLRAKLLMQDIWRLKLGWDERLPESLNQQWQEISTDFECMGEIKFKRASINEGKIVLHAFSDASTRAYGSVIYAVQGGRSEFIIAKSRVAPIKNEKLSIPRLELAATTIAARLINYVQDAFKEECVIDEIHIWSDSQVALGWIHARKALSAYMQNRVDEVRRRVPEAQWHYVPTKENPADVLSRGCKVKQLKSNRLWWHGPAWITSNSLPSSTYPVLPILSAAVNTQVSKSNNESVVDKLLANCGTYVKAVRVVAWIKRYLNKVHPKGKQQTATNLSTEEITEAERTLLKQVQIEAYQEEMAYLKAPTKGQCPTIVKQLHLNLRDDYIVCETRLKEAEIAETAKNPVLLPSKHRLTELLIVHVHKKNMHMGVAATLAHLRQRWWIPQARQRVKTILAKCVTCRRQHCAAYPRPPVPPLPKIRVQESRPFAVIGLDYGGPLNAKNDGVSSKRYIALFTCAVTRAIHLELARDLSAEAFLQTFQRFVARRSYPSIIISDNGTNFVSGADTLKLWENNSDVQDQMRQMRCKWRFIPTRAPWFGGMYERLIGMTKMTLRKVLGRTSATDEELQTLLCRIEAQLNDRPLTHVSDQLTDAEPLTPSMLLQGYRHDSVPTPVTDPDEGHDPTVNERELLTRRQRHNQLTLEKFWLRWSTEYLMMLRHQKHREGSNTSPKVSDVVLVHDEGKRLWWRLGRIKTLQYSKDGQVRSAEVSMANGTSTRPIAKLYPLEVSGLSYQQDERPSHQAASDSQNSGKSTGANTALPSNRRPQRAAAKKASQRIAQQAETIPGGECGIY